MSKHAAPAHGTAGRASAVPGGRTAPARHAPALQHAVGNRALTGALRLQRECACGGGGSGGPCTCGSKHDKTTDDINATAATESTLNRDPTGAPGPDRAPTIVHDVVSSPGDSLDRDTQSKMESQFGHDFSDVRVHTNAQAAHSARAVNANAYTVGRHVVFGDGRYQPHDSGGRRLIAHELTHVVQQRGAGPVSAGTPLRIDPSAHDEQQARSAGESMSGRAGAMSMGVPGTGGAAVARDADTTPADPLETARSAIDTAAIGAGALGIAPDNDVWGALNVLWIVHLLQVLEDAGRRGQLDALDRFVDQAGGGVAPRLRVAIDAVKMKLGNAPPGQIDAAFYGRLSALGDDKQTEEVVRYLSGPANMAVLVTPPKVPPGTPDFLHPQAPPPGTANKPTADNTASMSTVAKLIEAMTRGATAAPGAGATSLLAMVHDKTAMAEMAAFLTVYLVSQATPAGWVTDIVGGGLFLISVAMVGADVIDIVKHLVAFGEKATNAKTDPELTDAGNELAAALAKGAIDIIMAFLFHKAGKAVRGASPYLRPPPPADISIVEVDASGAKPASPETFAANDNAFPNNENFRGDNVIDLDSRRPGGQSGGGASASGGGDGISGSNALKIQPVDPDLQPEVQPQPLQVVPDPAPLADPNPAPQAKGGVKSPTKVPGAVVGAGAAAGAQQAVEAKKKTKPDREECDARWKTRSGGPRANYHNDFAATMVSRFQLPAPPELDYSVSKGGQYSTDYDSYDNRGEDCYEFKTKHQYLKYDAFDLKWVWESDMVHQAGDQRNTMTNCGITGKLIWVFDDQDVALAARDMVMQQGVDIVQAEPWDPPGGSPKTRKPPRGGGGAGGGSAPSNTP